jgi:hypothetical protein
MSDRIFLGFEKASISEHALLYYPCIFPLSFHNQVVFIANKKYMPF